MLSWSASNAKGCTASGAWTGARAPSGSESTGTLTSDKTYKLDCVGDGGTATKSASITVTDAVTGPTAGLDFKGSGSTGGTVRFEFTNPLAMYPATYVWRVMPRQQAGYYTTFFWGNNGTFLWNQGSPDSYYGAHPYPTNPPNGSTHKWEIAVGGGDVVSNEDVVYNVWYTQALRVWSDGSGKQHEFYWNLPDTSKVVRWTERSSYGEARPPSPALVFGDAPWNPSNEIMNGILRGVQIYTQSLSLSDIQAEIASPRSTSAGAGSIWYLNLNPTPSDISDKSGKGNNPSWVGSERPSLWNGQ